MEYYTVKKNEVLVFAATWMDLEIIILSGATHRMKIINDITYMWNAKNNAYELIYKIAMDSQKKKLMFSKAERWKRVKLEIWDQLDTHYCT